MTDPIPSIFGKISPPPGCGVLCSDPITGLGKFFGVLLNIILVVFGILLITYMIWGAMDWITSEGDKDAKQKANAKITNAIMGLMIFVITLTIFGLISGNVLGIIKKTPAGWELNIPLVNKSSPSVPTVPYCPFVCRIPTDPRSPNRGCLTDESPASYPCPDRGDGKTQICCEPV